MVLGSRCEMLPHALFLPISCSQVSLLCSAPSPPPPPPSKQLVSFRFFSVSCPSSWVKEICKFERPVTDWFATVLGTTWVLSIPSVVFYEHPVLQHVSMFTLRVEDVVKGS